MKSARLVVLITIILVAAAARVIPHPPNFTPIAAMALFGGAYAPTIWQAVLVPVGAMVVSDLIIGWHPLAPVIYLSFVLIVGIGCWLRTRKSLATLVAAVGASSVSFFLVTNFAVWASGAMYPKTGAGLLAAYVAGLPFLRNTVLGDLFYSAVLFGSFAAVERYVASVREAPRAVGSLSRP